MAQYLRLQRQMFRKAERELTRAEYQRLLDAAQARGDIRLLLLLETLCATGIRVSELQYITVEAVRNGVAEIALKGKIRTILLPTKLCRKLLKYANKYPPAKPGVFIIRAKPYVTSHASCGVGTTCHLHRLSSPHWYKSITFSFSYSCHS